MLSGCPAPARYREVRPGLGCERATRVAYRTMLEIGYTVTEVVPVRPTDAITSPWRTHSPASA